MSFRHTSFRRLLTVLTSAAALGCVDSDPTRPSDPATESFAPSLGVDIATMTKGDVNGSLYIKDLVVGTGALVVKGDSIHMLYTGWLKDGTQFDAATNPAAPIKFRIGRNQVIPGWDIGIAGAAGVFDGMRVGGKRKLVVGSLFAYGARSFGQIPEHATLVFDVELVKVIH